MKKVDYSDKFDFEVVKEPFFTKDQTPANGFYATRRVDNGEVLGVCGKGYGIVQNTDLIDIAESVFAKRGLTYDRKAHVLGGGEKMIMSYQFKNFNRDVNKKGDIVGLGVNLQNSFDGTKLASITLGLLRLVCMNGMTRLEKEFGIAKRHTQGVSFAGIDNALNETMEGYDLTIALLGDMSAKAIDQAQGNRLIDALSTKGVIAARNAEKVKAIWENPRIAEDSDRNVYNLYNAITDFTSHDLQDAQIDLRNRITSASLNVLGRATHDNAYMEELLALPA